jgi:hypothetical protein
VIGMGLFDDPFGKDRKRRNRERDQEEFRKRAAGNRERSDKLRKSILEDDTIGDLTRNELLSDLDERFSKTWLGQSHYTSELDFGDYRLPGILDEVTDLLQSAREGTGEKFAARKATEERFKIRRERPGLKQLRSSGGGGGIL